MSKRYCVVNTEYNLVETPGHDTPEEAKQFYIDTTGVDWDDKYYEVQAFTQNELDSLPED